MSERSVNVPETREEAIEVIAELDVAKWGESERDASRRMNEDKSYGLLLNSLAHREEYGFGDDAPELVAAARAALTPKDWAYLRQGG